MHENIWCILIFILSHLFTWPLGFLETCQKTTLFIAFHYIIQYINVNRKRSNFRNMFSHLIRNKHFSPWKFNVSTLSISYPLFCQLINNIPNLLIHIFRGKMSKRYYNMALSNEISRSIHNISLPYVFINLKTKISRLIKTSGCYPQTSLCIKVNECLVWKFSLYL